MSLSLGIIFGLITLVCWGAADFFAAKAVRKADLFETLLWSQIISFICFLLLFFALFQLPIFTWETVKLLFIAGFLSALTFGTLYKGLKIGHVSVITPIVACWSVVTAILSVIFLNEKLTGLQIAGIVFAITGAILTSIKLEDLKKSKRAKLIMGIEYAIITAVAWGIGFTITAVIVERLGWFLPMFFNKTIVVFYLLIYAGIARKKMAFPRQVILWILLIGILEAVAISAYGIGLTHEYSAVMAPISAAYPMVTIILARIFFRETLGMNQKIGILAVIAGLVLLSLK